ncbi:mechanosensitive ion channel [Paenibacillus sp. J5C_2022]|uniref:mechanosensitive ion channel family protein n=1 Tax=Paenibacillus sp. J5C2022 TaxID=2977129 RepID=UPI0021CF1957|nr:mechanosensitive ion channel domain-containing protein [Paenibacillus sp. J5C2022]MCU6708730.1 mechanosensitive ion channel [Paenibacillus sp. J5C2022]
MDWMDIVLPYVQKIALAIVVLVVGWVVIKWVTKWVGVKIENSKMDANIKPFLVTMLGAILKVLLVLSVIRIVGIDTTSFVAVIAAAGFAIGLAFQGSLSNFAGGVLLLTLRPFKTGDYIEAAGYSGTVKAIQILYTELNTPDNKIIYIPNGSLSNAGITNYSVMDTRRVDFKFGVGYEQDFRKVIRVLNEIVQQHDKVLKDPEPFVRMSEHADSAVMFTVRAWTKAEDYWDVHFDIIESVKARFDEEGISIPFPQMDVHVHPQQK